MAYDSTASSGQKIRVIIVDDHSLFRQGLKNALGMTESIKVIADSEDGKSAIPLIKQENPDVVLLDVNLPEMNGLQVARALNMDSDVRASIVILTAHHDEEQVIHALRSGAAAYCNKDISGEQLINIIQDVAGGYFVVHDKRMRAAEKEAWLDEKIQTQTPYFEDDEGHFIPLSPREMEILEYVTKGLINKEIASQLGISQQTVKNHMTSILRKMNVKDRTQAAIVALRRGWVRLNETTDDAQG